MTIIKYPVHSKTSNKCCFPLPSNYWIFALRIWIELGVNVNSILDRKPEILQILTVALF